MDFRKIRELEFKSVRWNDLRKTTQNCLGNFPPVLFAFGYFNR